MKARRRKKSVDKTYEAQLHKVPVNKHQVIGMMIFATGVRTKNTHK